jgi:hypothetical protein
MPLPNCKIQFRLSARQIKAILPGLQLIVQENALREQGKGGGHRFPQYLQHPNPGKCHPDLMAPIEETLVSLRGVSGLSHRVSWNTLQIRSAMLAIRVNVDALGYRLREEERRARKNKRKRAPSSVVKLNQGTIELARKRGGRVLRSLERQLTPSNRLAAKTAGNEYQQTLRRWQEHLQWIRTRLVYFRPLKPVGKTGTFYRATVLKVIENMTAGLKDWGYPIPSFEELRRLARSALKTARREEEPWLAGQLREGSPDVNHFLADIAIRRCHLIELKVPPPPRQQAAPCKKESQSLKIPKIPDVKPVAKVKLPKSKPITVRKLAPHRQHQRRALENPETMELLRYLRINWRRLDQPEQADRIGALLARGCTRRGLAQKLRVAPTTIGRKVRIANLPIEQQDSIKQGASAKAILTAIDDLNRKEKFALRLNSDEKRSARVRELADFTARFIEGSGASSGDYGKLQKPIKDFAQEEAHRLADKLGPDRFPTFARDFDKVLGKCEPPRGDDRQELRRQLQWIGITVARIEPAREIVQLAITEAFRLLREVTADKRLLPELTKELVQQKGGGMAMLRANFGGH